MHILCKVPPLNILVPVQVTQERVVKFWGGGGGRGARLTSDTAIRSTQEQEDQVREGGAADRREGGQCEAFAVSAQVRRQRSIFFLCVCVLRKSTKAGHVTGSEALQITAGRADTNINSSHSSDSVNDQSQQRRK